MLVRIDFEAHYYTQDFLDSIADRKEIPIYETATQTMYHGGEGIVGISPILPKLLDLTEQRIRDMDAAGVTTAILSASLGVEQLPEEEGCIAATRINNALGEAIRQRPDRLKGYAVLNVKNIDRAVAELERCRSELGFVGWNAFSNFGERNLDDPEMFPLFAKAVELGMFVYVHPTAPADSRFSGYGPALATSGLGFAMDVATAVSRLILSGIFDKLPDLKIVIGHSGEAFPFLIQRLDDADGRTRWSGKAQNQKKPSDYFKTNIWMTTSGNFSLPAFRCAYDAFGIDHIMFGTDYPMESMEKGIDFVDHLPISMADTEKLYHGNAAHYFGISL